MTNGTPPERYPEGDIEIIELGDSTSVFIQDFFSEIPEIEKFLKEDALAQLKEGVNRTFLWMSRNQKKLLGYITICVDAINLDRVQKDELIKKNIRYKALPALKIGRMGVNKEFRGKGIGTLMIAFTTKRALDIHKKAACRFITLDAKNDEKIPEHLKPLRFYTRNGFQVLKTKQKDNVIHMYKDLIEIIKIEQKKI